MYDLELSAKGITVKLNGAFVGEDLLVWIGGGRAHIGAVAVAVPRPSLSNEEKTAADATVMTVGGHKEDLLARKIALALACKLNVKVCVSAGLHWDAATPAKIEAAKELCMRLTKTLLMHIAKDGQEEDDSEENAAAGAPPANDGETPPAEAAPPAPGASAPEARPAPANRPAGARPAGARPAGQRPAAAGNAAAKKAQGVVTTPAGVIIEDTEEAPRPASPAPRPAGARQVQRDAQGRPVSVRQAVNATLKKPLLKK